MVCARPSSKNDRMRAFTRSRTFTQYTTRPITISEPSAARAAPAVGDAPVRSAARGSSTVHVPAVLTTSGHSRRITVLTPAISGGMNAC